MVKTTPTYCSNAAEGAWATPIRKGRVVANFRAGFLDCRIYWKQGRPVRAGHPSRTLNLRYRPCQGRKLLRS